ncbi:ATP-binding protein [Streptomyces cinnamoneus]|uniref:ATP-binding protein n=1 Tax=Streptomyces cinnamoneus TaxID=53446 RepID=UPI00342F92FC
MSSVSLCPLSTPAPQEPADHLPHPVPLRDPESLAYSYAIPGEPHAAAVARQHVHTALRAHGLDGMEVPALHAVGELIACAALFEPGKILYLTLGWKDDGIRIVLWDPHTKHADPDYSAQCTARRNKMLYVLACVVHECGGSWGIDKPAPMREGTRVWVNLPREGGTLFVRDREGRRAP